MRAEDSGQATLMDWLSLQHPDVYKDTYHIPLERKCTPSQAGVADIFIAIPSNGYHGLWIELKSDMGRLTDEQHAFLLRMSSRGYVAVCAYGFDEAKDIINTYFGRQCYAIS